MTVTELGLHSPWLGIARQRDYPTKRDFLRVDGTGVPVFGRAPLRDAYRGQLTSGSPSRVTQAPDGIATPRQWITLHVNGTPEACAYTCLTDAVASLARRPVGCTYEIFRGGTRLFCFGVALVAGDRDRR